MSKKIALISGAVLLVLLVLFAGACSHQAEESKKEGGSPSALKPGQVGFQEFPIGDEKIVEGMSVAAVYFQASAMEPKEKAGLGIEEADIHIEADIKADKSNKVGFGSGEFVPYLKVGYKVEDSQTGETQEGTFMPMNASDGPHYGANIKMGAAGKYKLTYTISPPQDYLLHVDDVTGVKGRFFKKPLVVTWDFNYVPVKK